MTLLQRDPDRRYQDGYSAKRELDRAMHNLAPGYTPSRLSRFIEDKFEDVIRQKIAQANGQAKAQAAAMPVASLAPSTPAPAAPGFGQGFGNFGQAPSGPMDSSDTVEHRSPFAPGGEAAAAAAPGFGERVRTDAPPQPVGFGPPPNTPAFGATAPAFGATAPAVGPDGTMRTATATGKTGEFDTASLGTAPPAKGGVDKKTVGLIAGVLFMGLIMVGMGVYALAFMDDGVEAPAVEEKEGTSKDEPAEAKVEAPVAKVVSVTIGSTPEGAKVLQEGEELGVTPLSFKLSLIHI